MSSPSRRSTTPPTTTPPPVAPTWPPDLADRRGRRPLRRAVRRADVLEGHVQRVVAARRDNPGGRPMSMPFYVPPEQVMKDRADFARKGIARGRSVIVARLRPRHRVRRREPFAGPAQGLRDLRPHRLRRGRSVQRVREPAGRRHPLRRPARLLLRPHRRHRSGPGQHVRPDARGGLHPGVQALRDRDRRRRGRGRPPTATRSSGSPTTARSPTSRASSRWAAPATPPRSGSARVAAGHDPGRGPATRGRRARRRRERRAPRALARASSRSPCSTATVRAAVPAHRRVRC